MKSDEDIEPKRDSIKHLGQNLNNLTFAITKCINDFFIEQKGFGKSFIYDQRDFLKISDEMDKIKDVLKGFDIQLD